MSSIAQRPFLICSGRHILNPEEWAKIQLSLKMSARELQVTQHIFDDSKTECIAETLGISVYTVNTYVQRLYLKLNVRSRSQLVLCVMKAHLEHLSIARESQVRSWDLPNCSQSHLEPVASVIDIKVGTCGQS